MVRIRPVSFACALACSLAFALTASATAQGGSWSPDFGPPGIGGRVFSFADWNGELYAGGHVFTAAGGPYRSIARFDGTRWQHVGGGVDGATWGEPVVRAMTTFGTDLIVAGTFSRAGGQPANAIARWDGTAWHPLGGGLQLSFGDAEVFDLAVYNQELYAAGSFDLAGGQPAVGLARWDGSAWHAVGSGLADVANLAPGIGRALLAHGGLLWIGGDFDRAGGVAAASVATWNGSSYAAVGAGAQFGVRALDMFGGEVVAAGQFQFGNVTAMVGAWNGSSWHGLGQGGPDLPVTSLAVVGSDLFAGGTFTNVGTYVAKWDGAVWSSIGGVNGIFSGTINTMVLALHASGGDLLVGGEFTNAGSSPGHPGAVGTTGVAVYGPGGWRGLGEGLGCNGTFAALLPYRGGLFAAGNFAQVGNAVAWRAAFFDGDRWAPMGRFDAPIGSAVVWNDDVIVSGGFRNVDGRPISGIARWDGAQWQPFGTLNAVPLAVWRGDVYAGVNGSLMRWNGTAFAAVASVAQGVISELFAHADGNLYLAADSAFQHGIHRWDGSQLAAIGAPNSFVHCLGGFGGELLAGGRFTAIGGASANLLARWDGSSWRPFAQGVSGYSVDALAELDGRLYAAVSGDGRGFLLEWNGTAWRGLGGPNGVPQVLLADRASRSLFAAGRFFDVGGRAAWNLARFDLQPAWLDLWHGDPQRGSGPLLLGGGTPAPAGALELRLEGPALHVAVLVLGLGRADLPAFGATLLPRPDLGVLLLGDAAGGSRLPLPLPASLPAIDVFAQAWLLDVGGAAPPRPSNALRCRLP